MNRENKLLFVYNPRSGKGQIKNKLSEILNIFAGAGYEITVRPTQCRRMPMRQLEPLVSIMG